MFYNVFFSKDSILYAAAIAFIFFIVMDICCSITEDIVVNIYEAAKKRKKRKLKEKEEAEKKKKEEMQEIENILTEKRDYQSDVIYVESEFEEYREYLKLLPKEVPKQVQKSLKDISVQLQIIIDILHEDAEQYQAVRHMFKAYFPEFKRMAQKYVNIITTENDENATLNFLKLVVEFQEYLESVIAKIQDTDKVSFDVGIRALTKIIEAERKKGEE